MIPAHVVRMSGGLTSWGAARRVVDAHGTAGVVLLFADTRIEDEDLYRFLADCARDLGLPITRIADGRTPWEVFRDERYLGNTRADPCSKILKRELLDRWTAQNAPGATHYVGLDWTEQHRVDRFKAAMHAQGVAVAAPLCEPPYVTKSDLAAEVRRRGFEPPRLYALGFPHNNCGGFCVKAGQSQFRLLLKALPERYAHHEAQEEALRAHLGKDVAIMRDRRGGKPLPLTMRAFRERVQQNESIDLFDWGGCGCAVDVDPAAPPGEPTHTGGEP
jgi:hypothetical protein